MTRLSMDKSEDGDGVLLVHVTWLADTDIALRKWWVFQNVTSSMLVLINDYLLSDNVGAPV